MSRGLSNRVRYELRGKPSEEGLIDELALLHPRLGVVGLLRLRVAGRGPFGYRCVPPQSGHEKPRDEPAATAGTAPT